MAKIPRKKWNHLQMKIEIVFYIPKKLYGLTVHYCIQYLAKNLTIKQHNFPEK